MPPLARALGFLCGVLSLAVLLWVGRYSPLATWSQERFKAEEERAWSVQKRISRRLPTISRIASGEYRSRRKSSDTPGYIAHLDSMYFPAK